MISLYHKVEVNSMTWAALPSCQPCAGPQEESAVAALQETICQSPPEHYSRAGARPLLYASVLAISLQYRRLLLFLHSDRTAAPHRDVAPVLATALFSTGMLRVQPGDESSAGTDASPNEASHAHAATAAKVRLEEVAESTCKLAVQ